MHNRREITQFCGAQVNYSHNIRHLFVFYCLDATNLLLSQLIQSAARGRNNDEMIRLGVWHLPYLLMKDDIENSWVPHPGFESPPSAQQAGILLLSHSAYTPFFLNKIILFKISLSCLVLLRIKKMTVKLPYKCCFFLIPKLPDIVYSGAQCTRNRHSDEMSNEWLKQLSNIRPREWFESNLWPSDWQLIMLQQCTAYQLRQLPPLPSHGVANGWMGGWDSFMSFLHHGVPHRHGGSGA